MAGGLVEMRAGVGAVEVRSSMIAVAVSRAVLLALERRGAVRPRSRWRIAATLAVALPRSRRRSRLGFSSGDFSGLESRSRPGLEADMLLFSRRRVLKAVPSRLRMVAVSMSTARTACLRALSSLSSSLSFPLARIFSSLRFSERLDEELASFPSFPSLDFSDFDFGAAFSAAAAAFCWRRKSMSGVDLGFSGFSPEGSGTDSGSFRRAEPAAGEAMPSAGAAPSAVPLEVGTVPTPLMEARKAIKSGSLSMVPARASTRPPFLGNFWKGEYSICGLVVLPLESVKGPCARSASLRAVICVGVLNLMWQRE